MCILMLLVKGFQLYIFPSCFVQKNVSFPVSRSAPLRVTMLIVNALQHWNTFPKPTTDGNTPEYAIG